MDTYFLSKNGEELLDEKEIERRIKRNKARRERYLRNKGEKTNNQKIIEWQKNNPEKVKQTKKRYRIKNYEKIDKYQKEYKEKNKEKMAIYSTKWRLANKEKIKEYCEKNKHILKEKAYQRQEKQENGL